MSRPLDEVAAGPAPSGTQETPTIVLRSDYSPTQTDETADQPSPTDGYQPVPGQVGQGQSTELPEPSQIDFRGASQAPQEDVNPSGTIVPPGTNVPPGTIVPPSTNVPAPAPRQDPQAKPSGKADAGKPPLVPKGGGAKGPGKGSKKNPSRASRKPTPPSRQSARERKGIIRYDDEYPGTGEEAQKKALGKEMEEEAVEGDTSGDDGDKKPAAKKTAKNKKLAGGLKGAEGAGKSKEKQEFKQKPKAKAKAKPKTKPKPKRKQPEDDRRSSEEDEKPPKKKNKQTIRSKVAVIEEPPPTTRATRATASQSEEPQAQDDSPDIYHRVPGDGRPWESSQGSTRNRQSSLETETEPEEEEGTATARRSQRNRERKRREHRRTRGIPEEKSSDVEESDQEHEFQG